MVISFYNASASFESNDKYCLSLTWIGILQAAPNSYFEQNTEKPFSTEIYLKYFIVDGEVDIIKIILPVNG